MIWVYLICSYFVGTIMFGYLVTKILFRDDIRLQGSGNVGARNAGRLYGKKAFILIFIGDALKGILVVLVAKWLNFPEYLQMIGLALVIIGHIKPVTIGFRGGKGVSTFIGGIIAFEPLVAVVIITAFLLVYILMRGFTLSGLGSLLLIPLYLLYRDYTWLTCVVLLGIIFIIIIAHSENIKERLS